MHCVVWVDEEVGSFDRTTRKLTGRGVRVVKLLTASGALELHRLSGDALLAQGAKGRILVLDLMLAAGDDPFFTPQNTYGYMMTGHTLLIQMAENGDLNSYEKVVVHSAMKDGDHLRRLTSWIDAWHLTRASSATGSARPVIELRPKRTFGHEEMFAALLRDLGFETEHV